jgi:hypothetical protein
MRRKGEPSLSVTPVTADLRNLAGLIENCPSGAVDNGLSITASKSPERELTNCATKSGKASVWDC